MSQATTETITSFLEKILQEVHPLMAEGIYLAAAPNWYDLALFTAMRDRDDGRDQGIIDRLTRYSFIVPLQEDSERRTSYTVRPEERLFLRRHWIVKDPQAYLKAHERALAHTLKNPDPNPFAQSESRLYHQLLVDIGGGMDYLVDRFRAYYRERQFAAIDRLLETALDARFYLVLLQSASLEQFDDLLTHLEARLAQLRGHWGESLEGLRGLRQKPELAPWLLPYVARALGYGLAHTGDFVGAIEQYDFALELFAQEATTITGQASVQTERAHTMIALGEAHVGLAKSVRGYDEKSASTTGGLARLRIFLQFFLSLPLVLYLSFFLGRRVWHPRFWPTLDGLDWIIARLFATGAKLYARADPVLEAHGTPSESVKADEQLAYLYLAMGDAEQAQLLFSRLLTEEEAPLGEYRQASVRVGLGEALLAMGQYGSARQHLESALPILSLYQDADLFSEAQMFLAEALLESGETEEAVSHLRMALRMHQRQNNPIMSTEVAERLEQMARDSRIEAEHRERAGQYAADVVIRHYPLRYRHLATAFFHRAAIGLLGVVIFIILATIIRLDTGITIAPEVTFNASPLLRSDTPDFTPDLSQGVVALNIATIPNPRFLLWLGAVLLGAYLVISTCMGMLAILRMSLKKVQASSRAGLVRFDGNELQVGEAENRQTVRVKDVIRYYRADTFFVDALMVDDSTLTLITPDQRIKLKGNTTWYTSLRDRIVELAPEKAQPVDFSYSLLRSRMGAWYLVTVGAILLLSFFGQLASQWVTNDIPGLRYSLADLYPLLYLGLFLPPMWWFVLQPLRVRLFTDPLHPFPWWIGSAGAAIALLRAMTLFRPWLTIPEIYSPLMILTLVAGAAIVIVKVKHPRTGELHYPNRTRAIVVLVSLAICFITVQDLWREVGAYHHRVIGDSWRDQALLQERGEEQTVQLKEAVGAYSRAIDTSSIKVMGIDNRVAARVPLGIPPVDHFTWVEALGSRAAMLSQLGQYGPAVDDYTELLDHVKVTADVYADRAVAYQGLGTAPGSMVGTVEVATQSYAAALADFDEAIALDPDNAEYLLWRGVAYHALGDMDNAAVDYQSALETEGDGALGVEDQANAWTGLGWISFVDKNYRESVDWFQLAEEAAADSSGAQIGLGYVYYSTRQYDNALEAWEQAAEQNPSDPIAFISLGTLYWRIGTLGVDDYGTTTGSDRCSSAGVTEAEKSRSAVQLEKSINNFGRSTEIPGQESEELAFTFRTMGQVQFLLRNCPGYDSAETLKGSVAYYDEAVQHAPDNASYWHFKGRLAYSVWLNSPPGSGPAAREWLFVGLSDQEMALALEPEDVGDYRPNRWWTNSYAEAVDGSLVQGDLRFENGEYALAADYYELVANNRADHIESAFKAGLANLAAGEQDSAAAWYQEAFDRAQAIGDDDAAKEAGASIQKLTARQSGVRLGAINELFLQNDIDLGQPQGASVLFEMAAKAVQEQKFGEAIDLFAQGLTLAAETGEVGLAANAALGALSTSIADDVLPLLKRSLPQFERAAGNSETATEDAFKVALFAGVVSDPVTAAKWYNEGIKLSALNSNYPPLRDTRSDLRDLWSITGVESGAVLTQMQRQLPSHLDAFPELQEHGLYWRFRAWFKYGAGLSAFRLGEENAARSALSSAQSDADRAFEIDSSGNAYVQSYLKEGAWGWYHVRRGDDFLAADELKQALADYEAAVRLITPVENDDVRNDIVTAAFKAGYVAILLPDAELSRAWYQQGVELMRKYGSEQSVLRDGIAALETLSDQQRGSAAIIDSTLKYLRALES